MYRFEIHLQDDEVSLISLVDSMCEHKRTSKVIKSLLNCIVVNYGSSLTAEQCDYICDKIRYEGSIQTPTTITSSPISVITSKRAVKKKEIKKKEIKEIEPTTISEPEVQPQIQPFIPKHPHKAASEATEDIPPVDTPKRSPIWDKIIANTDAMNEQLAKDQGYTEGGN